MNIEKCKDMYKHKIEVTYKCRINAAERLKNIQGIIQFFNIYYSAIIAISSIYALTISKDSIQASRLSFVTTITSILLLIFTTFLNSKKYGERARELKDNYIALGTISRKIISCDNEDDINKVGTKYDELLNNSENHSEVDYCKTLVEIKRASSTQSFRYFLYLMVKNILAVLFFVIPLVMFYATCK